MKQPIIRMKEVDGKRVWASTIIVHNDQTISNPPEELWIQDGWKTVIPEDPRLYEDNDELPEPEDVSLYKLKCPEIGNVLCCEKEGLVYHYCTWETLFSGIMNTDNLNKGYIVLRAYCVNYMNDTNEHKLMVIQQMEAEKEWIRQSGINPPPLYERRENLIRRIAEQGKNNWFAICFSKDSDSLPMWNYYGMKGRGLAIGIDAHEIWNQGFVLYDCIYDMAKIRLIAQKCYASISDNDDGNMRIFPPAIIDCLAKDAHFEYEKESRILLNRFSGYDIVKSRRDNFYSVQYGLKGNVIAPYVDIMLPISSIKKICIGPTNNPERAKQSLISWLNHLELRKDIKITNSSAPIAQE